MILPLAIASLTLSALSDGTNEETVLREAFVRSFYLGNPSHFIEVAKGVGKDGWFVKDQIVKGFLVRACLNARSLDELIPRARFMLALWNELKKWTAKDGRRYVGSVDALVLHMVRPSISSFHRSVDRIQPHRVPCDTDLPDLPNFDGEIPFLYDSDLDEWHEHSAGVRRSWDDAVKKAKAELQLETPVIVYRGSNSFTEWSWDETRILVHCHDSDSLLVLDRASLPVLTRIP